MTAKIISFFSTKGGVGKTLLSLNLAVSLSRQKKKVLFLDFDLAAPQGVDKLLGIRSKYNFFILVKHLQEFKKNERDIHNYLASYSNSLYFLPAISRINQRSGIGPEQIKDFFTICQDKFDFIIVDSGSRLTDNLISIFDSSKLIVLVVTPDILAVYQTQWVLETLQHIGFPLKMINIVLNRAESKGSITWQEIKVLLPSEVITLIPSEGKIAGLSINRRVPLVIDSPYSKIAEAINKLSTKIITKKDYIEKKDLFQVRLKKEKSISKEGEGFWQKLGLAEKHQKAYLKEEEDKVVQLKKRVHKRLLQELDLKRLPIETYNYSNERMNMIRKKAEGVVTNIISSEAKGFIASHEVRRKIIKEIIDESLGLGALEDLLDDPDISEIMVNNKDQVYIEKLGKVILTSKKFTGDEQVRVVIERILAPLGRRIDESTPYVNARLPDGSRVNAIINPLSLTGPTLTIRKFNQQRYGMKELVDNFGSLTSDMAKFLQAAVKTRKNILVSGGTGSGKTTFLNILSSYIPNDERIITIEDAAELKIDQTHWVRLESRPPNIEGKGEVTIRDLFTNTLRMRPDRIVVGEVRSEEVIDMLQAMNTGHDGSMSTVHANSTHHVLMRLDSMVLMSGVDLPVRSIREFIASALHLIVHTARLSDGSRKVVAITEVVGMLDETHVELQDIFSFRQTGLNMEKKVEGFFSPHGYIPSFYDEMNAQGVFLPRDIFIPKE